MLLLAIEHFIICMQVCKTYRRQMKKTRVRLDDYMAFTFN